MLLLLIRAEIERRMAGRSVLHKAGGTLIVRHESCVISRWQSELCHQRAVTVCACALLMPTASISPPLQPWQHGAHAGRRCVPGGGWEEHRWVKPRLPRCPSAGGQGLGVVSDLVSLGKLVMTGVPPCHFTTRNILP